jgi:hypothetical protein
VRPRTPARRRWLALLGVSLGSLGLLACAGNPPPAGGKPKPPDYPGELVDSARLPQFTMRQRITARFQGREESLSCVLQSADGVLSLLVLTPFGSRALLLEQGGTAVSVTNYVGRELPFPPRFILLDVHRTLFRGLPGAPLADGAHEGVDRDEQIGERWQAGRLLERSFRRADGKPAGLIAVRYEGGMRGNQPPARIDYDNGWLGYQLIIQTLEWSAD